jgi:hypothetical protein
MNTLASAVASRPVGLEVLELRELSLAINAPEGMVIVVSRSYSRVERIVNEAEAINSHIHMIAGGFHLVTARWRWYRGSRVRHPWHVHKLNTSHPVTAPAGRICCANKQGDLDGEGLRWGAVIEGKMVLNALPLGLAQPISTRHASSSKTPKPALQSLYVDTA